MLLKLASTSQKKPTSYKIHPLPFHLAKHLAIWKSRSTFLSKVKFVDCWILRLWFCKILGQDRPRRGKGEEAFLCVLLAARAIFNNERRWLIKFLLPLLNRLSFTHTGWDISCDSYLKSGLESYLALAVYQVDTFHWELSLLMPHPVATPAS